MNVKIGELFGASVFVSTYVHHDQIWISPKEERLFVLLLEMEKRLRNMEKSQDLLGTDIIKVGLGLDDGGKK